VPPSSDVGRYLDTLGEFAEAGVGWVVVDPPADDPAATANDLARFGAEVIEKQGVGGA
jgi:hypothetical protein